MVVFTFMIGIYKIKSPTNRIYIGQSLDIEKRFSQYNRIKNCKSQIKLHRSFLKHGVESHVFEIIEECNIELLNERERFWQDYYDVLNGGLNCVLTNTKDRKKILSKETKLKISTSNKGKKIGCLNPFFGKKHSKETRVKIGVENSKRIISENTRQKISKFHLGRKRSYETKLKISISNKGKKTPLDVVERIAQKRRKIIIDTETGIFYFGSKELSLLLNMKLSNIYYFLKTNERYKITK